MSAAAGSGNLAAVLEAQARTRNACVACHGTFREEVRRALY
jgi:cytochrome c556